MTVTVEQWYTDKINQTGIAKINSNIGERKYYND